MTHGDNAAQRRYGYGKKGKTGYVLGRVGDDGMPGAKVVMVCTGLAFPEYWGQFPSKNLIDWADSRGG